MALTAQQAYALSKKFTTDSIAGAGAIKGAPCEIQSTTPIEGGTRIVFQWEDTEGNVYTDSIDVMDGEKGSKGDKGNPGAPGAKGEDGNDGFSPTIVVKSATSEEYILTITDETGSYDTPNLKGHSSLEGSYSNENLSLY